MSNALAITGIHTGIGKTITAAVLTQALQCDYWKPIQAGELEHSDSMTVQNLLSNPKSRILPEAYALKTPASPHQAAAIEVIEIKLDSLAVPNHQATPLLIETAGGVMSPINAKHTVADLLAHHQWPTVLVVQHYLGSINHTLSAIESLEKRDITIIGLIINGAPHSSSESFIENYTHRSIIAHIPNFAELNSQTIAMTALEIRQNLPSALQPWMTL